MTVTDRIASSSTLTALARVAMFITPILVTVGLFIIGNWLQTNAKSMDTLSSRIDIVQAAQQSGDQRLGALESRSNIIGPSRDAFQRETQTAIKELTAALNILVTDVATTKRDVGYLRDFIEDIKRQKRTFP